MFKTKNRNSRPAALPGRGGLKGALLGGALMLGTAAVSSGCLDRPVEPLSPNTSNVFVKAVRTSAIDKIDLVFMIDNSISMADKQKVLEAAVPNLLRRLIDPDCVDENDAPVGENADGTCPDGTKRQFTAVNNIHIATITSALGSHGGTVCAAPNANVINPNDMAHLLPTVRDASVAPNPDGNGFLSWTGGGQNLDALITTFQQHVVAAGENGCGFEASLEAWYRFLVDPHPPTQILNQGNASVRTEDDQVLLAQRAAFLRSDSLVAIIMLSDENDCSIVDQGIGWIVSTPDQKIAPASTTCTAENPNAKCCYSCFTDPPSGCSPDPVCANNARLPAELDRGNVRCAQQKRRFGIDLLWPTQRYIDGLTRTEIFDAWAPPGSPTVPNPLFISRPGADGQEAGPRDPSLVFLAGIIGVPWQDIATADSLTGAGLTYLTAGEINANGVWDKILGNPNGGVMPTNMLMFESIEPRAGADGTGQPLVGPDNFRGNTINGNEYNNAVPFAADGAPSNDDLQYACIFPLGADSIDCTVEANKNRCDCFSPEDLAKGKPLCEGNQQTYAKAYPGTRFLEVLKGIEDKAIVASICPKNPVGSNPTDPNAGYNPAVGAIIKRLGEVLGGQCLPRELDVNPNTGKVDCLVIEASPKLSGVCDPNLGREDVSPEVVQAVRTELRNTDACGGQTGIDCAQFKMCGIRQFTDPGEKEQCFTNSNSVNPGYCYIDPAKGPEAGGLGCTEPGTACSNPFVEDCPPEQQRILRFVSPPTEANAPIPAKGAITLTACVDS